MYGPLRQLLFCLNPEASHHLSLGGLRLGERTGLLRYCVAPMISSPVEVMGLRFANAVGLAAGLDKNGDYIDALGALGFGFIEIGTITPLPQPGNEKPRLFRLPQQQAIINRMGFNNKGVDYLVERVKARRFRGVLGINIGKNAKTPVENALDDYRICLNKVYAHADYITVNVSSPNTPGLRNLQFGESLNNLLAGIKAEQLNLANTHKRYVPIAVKIAPDMTDEEIHSVAQALIAQKMDAVIATNTTIGREGVESNPQHKEAGGLSGAPVREKSTHVVRTLATALQGAIPIIGVGGITESDHALEKIQAGASLVQIYSGFIYQGPNLIAQCAEKIAQDEK